MNELGNILKTPPVVTKEETVNALNFTEKTLGTNADQKNTGTLISSTLKTK